MSASRAKGTGAETAVVNYLRDNGWPHAERRALGGAKDRGDIAGVVSTVIEVKNCARMELAQWVDEAEVEAGNDDAMYGVVWHKRRGRGSPSGWFVTMSGATFTALLADALGIDRTAISAVGRAALGELLAANETTVLAEIDQAQQEVRGGR
jgi:hypothetical protein